MPTIFLIRHGQKEKNPGDPGLTELGKEQSRQTGEFLKQFPITKMISSPYKRTVETADEISAVLDLPYTTNKSLEERMNWADDGTNKDVFLKDWYRATRERDFLSPYGDSSRGTGKRVQQVITDYAQEDDHLVLITHGGAVIDYLRNTFDDEPLQHLLREYEFGNDYQMYNCAVNKVVLAGAEPKLEMLNFTEHLSQLTE